MTNDTAYKARPISKYRTNQEMWIKENVRPDARTTCNECGKWISKYWHTNSHEKWIMTKCGNCYFRQQRRLRGEE